MQSVISSFDLRPLSTQVCRHPLVPCARNFARLDQVRPGGRHVVSRGVPLCHVSDQRNSSVSDHRGQTLNHQHRLSGRLPFDVEEDCSKHRQLIAMINEGFTDEISAGLGAKVSTEARLLVSRLLTVQSNLRIKVAPDLQPFLKSVEGKGCCSLLLGHSFRLPTPCPVFWFRGEIHGSYCASLVQL